MLDKIESSLEQSIRNVAERYGYSVLSLHIAPDHVHLFLSAHPKHAPSKIVRTIKSSGGHTETVPLNAYRAPNSSSPGVGRSLSVLMGNVRDESGIIVTTRVSASIYRHYLLILVREIMNSNDTPDSTRRHYHLGGGRTVI